MNKIVALTLGKNSYAAMCLVLKLARTCTLSDTIFGNLIRYHHAVDPEILNALLIVLQHDGEKLELDETAVHNVVAACDIVRKMFACDAVDEVARMEGVKKWEDTAKNNIIDYCNFLIQDLLRNAEYKTQIEELLIQLDNNIQP